MRVVLLHNWSWLGGAVATALIEAGRDELWVIGAPVPKGERDPELIELARKHRVHAVAPRDVRHPRFLARLRVFAPDILLVATFPKKLPPALLAIPKIAAINTHASLLPRYRGALPEFWVIRNGEPEAGLSVHLMTEDFDAGHILAQARFPLTAEDSLITLSMKLGEVGPPLVMALLDRYRAGERPEGEPQDHTHSTNAPQPKPEDLAVRWEEPAAAIGRLLRAAYPVFEAHTRHADTRIVIRRLRPIAKTGPYAKLAPGELIVEATRRRVIVGTGSEPVLLESAEMESVVFGGYELAEVLGMHTGDVLRAAPAEL